jgi:cytochrome c oxidase cbb3-type subunit 1
MSDASSSATTRVEATESSDYRERAAIDASTRLPVVVFMVSGLLWLLVGSTLAFIASYKMHSPEFLADAAWLTFGRVRPAHLNTMIYGWASMTGIGVLLWLQARLSRALLPMRAGLTAVAFLWNIAVFAGTVAILAGGSTSVEWLEFPLSVAGILSLLFLVVFVASVLTFTRRNVEHVYVSQWYLFGAVFWFPFLYVAANLMIHGGGAVGIAEGTANWWFAHNVLGIWFTPIGLAAAYYFIPKVIGRPIHSYYLSILGFWTLAIFYNWAGTHHLIGGPIPLWLQSVGIVASMMMFVPVITVAINHHMTMVGHFHKLKYSPTLRFIVFGAMSYTLVSVQGSLTALRVVNETSHFTHYTIAHAHLGMYAFVTMILFGSVYYILPRLTEREWSSALLIKAHFWTTAVGMVIYWVGLTAGGWLQGRMMLNPDNAFLEVVQMTIPFLWSRSFAAVLMTIGHFIFAYLVGRMLYDWAKGRERQAGPTLLSRPEYQPESADTDSASGGSS